MSDFDGHRAKDFGMGLVLGALIGAGVALLFAPQSGEDTRRIIRKKAKKLAANAGDKYDDLKDRVRRARRAAESAIAD